MLLKEIAYRPENAPDDIFNFKTITYDYCGDLETLMQILLDLLFANNPELSVIHIHANSNHLSLIEPLIKSFTQELKDFQMMPSMKQNLDIIPQMHLYLIKGIQ